jgi:hypothetical protein
MTGPNGVWGAVGKPGKARGASTCWWGLKQGGSSLRVIIDYPPGVPEAQTNHRVQRIDKNL